MRVTVLLLWGFVLLSALLVGVLGYATWQLWLDYEEAKREADSRRRLELEQCLRHHPPHVSTLKGRAKGFKKRAKTGLI